MKAYEMAAELKGLREEVERLRHDIERHIAIASELATENEALRAELAEERKPDCRTCARYYEAEEDCFLQRRNLSIVCINGDAYVSHGESVRLYEIDAAMAGGE